MAKAQKYLAFTEEFMNVAWEAGYTLKRFGDQAFMYKGGVWTPITTPRGELKRILFQAGLTVDYPVAEKAKAAWDHVITMLPMGGGVLDAECRIACNNGVTVHLSDMKAAEHETDHFTTRRINVAYDADATCEEWLKILARTVDDKPPKIAEQYIEFIQQFFGMAVIGYNSHGARGLRKMVYLSGDPGTGKSSISETLRALFYDGDISSQDARSINSKFGPDQLSGKMALITDEGASHKDRLDLGVFKRLVTGEPISADVKYGSPVTFRFAGPILFTVNDMPTVDEETDALATRTVILNFTRKFTSDDAKVQLAGKRNVPEYLASINEYPGILNWALAGAKKAIEAGRLPDVDEAKEQSVSWRMNNDPTYAFMHTFVEQDAKVSTARDVLAGAVMAFAQYEYGAGKRLSMNQIKHRISRAVRGWGDQSNRTMYKNVRLREDGMPWLDRARQDGLIGTGSKGRPNVPNV